MHYFPDALHPHRSERLEEPVHHHQGLRVIVQLVLLLNEVESTGRPESLRSHVEGKILERIVRFRKVVVIVAEKGNRGSARPINSSKEFCFQNIRGFLSKAHDIQIVPTKTVHGAGALRISAKVEVLAYFDSLGF